jgi:hypothetical protein
MSTSSGAPRDPQPTCFNKVDRFDLSGALADTPDPLELGRYRSSPTVSRTSGRRRLARAARGGVEVAEDEDGQQQPRLVRERDLRPAHVSQRVPRARRERDRTVGHPSPRVGSWRARQRSQAHVCRRSSVRDRIWFLVSQSKISIGGLWSRFEPRVDCRQVEVQVTGVLGCEPLWL